MNRKIVSHTDLDVFQKAFDVSMRIFEFTISFPREETYSLTDQIRRSSRSVASNLAEAWRKRRYLGSFISKLSDCEAEAAETQVWLQYAVKCGYVTRETGAELYEEYNAILRTIVGMINHPDTWIITKPDCKK